MGIKVKYVDNEEELNICFSIRRKVFIEEQNIPEAIEMDDISVNAKKAPILRPLLNLLEKSTLNPESFAKNLPPRKASNTCDLGSR